MVSGRLGRGESGRGTERERDLGRERRGEGGRIRLELGRLLALGQVRADRPAVVFVEEVVDEVRRERDQIEEKETGGQGARDRERGGTAEPVRKAPHCAPILHDFKPARRFGGSSSRFGRAPVGRPNGAVKTLS